MILCSPFAPTVRTTTRKARYQQVGNELLTCKNVGGRYWDRTSDLFRVKEARSRCANRPQDLQPLARWRRDLNPCRRLCRPLPRLSATPPSRPSTTVKASPSGRRDSNPRPSPWQGDALPAALRPHVVRPDRRSGVPGDGRNISRSPGALPNRGPPARRVVGFTWAFRVIHRLEIGRAARSLPGVGWGYGVPRDQRG